jgi:putative membrane protein
MERPENMRTPGPLKEELLKSKKAISIIILFHLIGLIGLSILFTRSIFIALVPYHLLLMLVIIMLSHQNIDGRLFIFFLCLFILGYSVEWLGVNKHLLFGQYQYGKTLGLKISGVPLIIGVNWFLLTYSTGMLMQHSRLKSMLLRIIAGALLLVLLDMLIEPVAVRLDYWHWINDVIPLKNYYCWFFVSAFMLLIFEQFRFKKQSIVAPIWLLTEFIFFGILCCDL